MRAILLSLVLIFSAQTATHAEEALQQSHIYDCARTLPDDDKDWLQKDLSNYSDETGIQIFLITRSLNNEPCDSQQKKLQKKVTNTVIITLMPDPNKQWIEVTLTADLVQHFGLTHITIDLKQGDEHFLQAGGKALIGAADLVRNHFAYMKDAVALLNNEAVGIPSDDPYGSDVTAPLEETAPTEPSDIPPDEGSGPETPDTPKKPSFRREGQAI